MVLIGGSQKLIQAGMRELFKEETRLDVKTVLWMAFRRGSGDEI